MNIEAGRNQSPTDQHFLAGSLCLGSIRKLVTRWVSAGRARRAPGLGAISLFITLNQAMPPDQGR